MKKSNLRSRLACTRTILTMTLAATMMTAKAQLSNDSIAEDFRYLVKQLEATHPDPYSNFGGKAFFHRLAHETYWQLRDDSVTTIEEFCWRIRSFLAPLKDGHTRINIPQMEGSLMLIPIRLHAFNGGVFVSRLPREYQHLRGSRLMAIEDMPFEEFSDKLAALYPAENEIGKYDNVCGHCHQPMVLSRIVSGIRNDSVTYHLLTPEGKPVALRLPLIPVQKWAEWKDEKIETSGQFPTKNLSYAFVGKLKQTMYFRSTSIMARDNIEYIRKAGMDFYDYLRYTYAAFYDETMPTDTIEAIRRLPSFSEEFGKMLLQMKAHKAENLIIDLRGNGGGWTPITLPTLYQLFGDDYLKTNFQNYLYRILSPLYMQKLNTTLDQFNAQHHTNYRYGDYTFYEGKEGQREVNDDVRAKFVNNSMSTVQDWLAQQNGKPIYRPRHIYVLTDANTFSAAFHYTFYLWKMGAVIVGVPSSQASNTYMEQTAFTLPYTKLNGSISNSLQLFLPNDDPRAKQLTPDYMLTYDDYRRYNFDEQTEVLYLLDKISSTD